MKLRIFSLLALFPLLAMGAQVATFTGVITDSECARADHSSMRMGPTDAECTVACVDAHGAQYVLFDGKEAYVLSDQRSPERFAGQKVAVVGTLDERTKTLLVASIKAAE